MLVYNYSGDVVNAAYNYSGNQASYGYTYSGAEISIGSSPWASISWVPIGDSISDLTLTGTSEKPSTIKYQPFIQQEIPALDVINYYSSGSARYANGGCGYAFGNSSFYNIGSYVPSDVSIITLFGSVNDWKYRGLTSTYTNKLSKINSASTDANGSPLTITNPQDDLPSDGTLAGYFNEAIDRIHTAAPNAKIVVNPGLNYCISGGANSKYMLNAYFVYQACVQGWREKKNASNWLFMETWYYDANLTSTDDGSGGVIYSRTSGADTTLAKYIEDWFVVDKYLTANLNETFDSRKLKTMPEFGAAYAYDYTTVSGESYGHLDNLYHDNYLAPKFAHLIANTLNINKNNIPNSLQYNNVPVAFSEASWRNGSMSVGSTIDPYYIDYSLTFADGHTASVNSPIMLTLNKTTIESSGSNIITITLKEFPTISTTISIQGI